MLIIGYTVPKHVDKEKKSEHEMHLETLGRTRYKTSNSLLLSTDQNSGKVYLKEGHSITEVILSYNVTDTVYKKGIVKSIPYFEYKGHYYELNEFKSIGGKHKW